MKTDWYELFLSRLSQLHTRHCKHKLCNLNSSHCAWANKACCAAVGTTLCYRSYGACKLSGVVPLWLGAQAEGLMFVHIQPYWQQYGTRQHAANWHWRICDGLWYYTSQKTMRVCVCILQIFSYHLCLISLLLRHLMCLDILILSPCTTIFIYF